MGRLSTTECTYLPTFFAKEVDLNVNSVLLIC